MITMHQLNVLPSYPTRRSSELYLPLPAERTLPNHGMLPTAEHRFMLNVPSPSVHLLLQHLLLMMTLQLTAVGPAPAGSIMITMHRMNVISMEMLLQY